MKKFTTVKELIEAIDAGTDMEELIEKACSNTDWDNVICELATIPLSRGETSASYAGKALGMLVGVRDPEGLREVLADQGIDTFRGLVVYAAIGAALVANLSKDERERQLQEKAFSRN